MNKHPLLEMIAQQKNNKPVGIYSACSANELVLKACMEKAIETDSVLLIEATSNQVNQDGGYTGMKPQDFKVFVERLAKEVGFNINKLILGGDHLGPLTWSNQNEEMAMNKANELVRQYVLAGFTKIHIDTSMKLADDDINKPLSNEIIAKRGAMMAKSAMNAYHQLLKEQPNAKHPVFIVGSEVPIPGGSQDEDETLQITTVDDCLATIVAFKNAFLKENLSDAWSHVIGLVVQPGVEFGDNDIAEYDRKAAIELTKNLDNLNNIIFEGHSTDYQTKDALKEMVEDGIGILKVGPGLTFALREGLFALAHIEDAMYPKNKASNFIEVLDETMKEDPSNWNKHYHGTEDEIAFKRKYSFSDRCRYYLPNKSVQTAMNLMFNNLRTKNIPYSLLSTYTPIQYTKIRNRTLALDPEEIVKDYVKNCIEDYLYATQQQVL